MAHRITREFLTTTSIVATNSASSSPRVQFAAMAGGVAFVTAVSSATKIVWHAAIDAASTPVPLLDSAGAAVETPVTAGKAYALPDATFGASILCPVTDAGTATITVALKG